MNKSYRIRFFETDTGALTAIVLAPNMPAALTAVLSRYPGANFRSAEDTDADVSLVAGGPIVQVG